MHVISSGELQYTAVMIARLRGTVTKLQPGELVMDVQGVGYAVHVPIDVWDTIKELSERELWISTYVREDRFDLYGFADRSSRSLFEALISSPGIGPRMGLELCAVPHSLLLQAIHHQDAELLTTIKGIGRKKAEKLLIELKSMLEKDPSILSMKEGEAITSHASDKDAVAALNALGYDSSTIMHALKNLPADLTSTEERVAAALRSL